MEQSYQSEAKHQLAILVELVLYNKIRDIDEKKGVDERKEIIENFIQENRERFINIPYEEYVQYINYILERTETNIKRIKNEKEIDR